MTTSDTGRTAGIRYEADEKPPAALAFGLGLQLAILTAGGIVLTPAIVVRAAGGTEDFLAWAVFAAVAISGAILEFIAAPGEENLQDRIALLGERAEEVPAEREVSLRLLRHIASSVHHQQYHDTDIVTVRVDAPALR